MQSLPDMIAEAQNILTDYFTDMDGPYTSLNKHAGFLKSLSKQAIRDMPLESVFIAFSYLKYYVIRQAQKRGPYTEQHHNHPLFGDIEYRAVDETAFPAEIKILKSLQTRMDYSSRLKNAIRKTAQEAFEDFTQRDTFMKDIDRWPNIRRKKQRITGGSFLVIFNMAAAESFNLPYEHPAFSILPRYDRNLSFSMGHIGPDYAENREPDIRWNPSPPQHYRSCLFFIHRSP
ncbi:MAG: hypothetical protein LRY36_00800 [Alphaproteobacteria bacterium]|nr:hypothetical protein [Alphaproteobacteria bacterium]